MFAIKAGRAFDGEQQLPGGATVLIDDGRIVGVAPAAAALPDGRTVAEFPHATVLPGLIDTHVHLGGDGRDGALDRLADYSDTELAEVIETALRRHLTAGVTTVRDLGDRRWSVVQRRDRATGSGASGTGSTIVASGPPITSIRGHCWYMGGEAQGAAALRGAIRERAERRVDVVKIMVSGGVHTQVSLLQRLTERGIAVCPTVLARVAGARPSATESAFTQRFGLTRDAVRTHVRRMHRAGVRIAAGTDGGIAAAKPHGIVHTAISELVASGISAAEALTSATSIAAQVCGVGTRKGRLRAGYDADLLLVEGDLLNDISALTCPAGVMVQGRWAAEGSAAERTGLGQP